MTESVITLGLERCIANPPDVPDGARLGLLLNRASVDSDLRLSCDVVADRFPGQLKALFSPQHGMWGEQQANMIESPHTVYEPLGLPVNSLYSETRRPTAEMLAPLDCLLIDLQDVGTRVYTFAWTMLQCLRACAEAGVSVLVLDRPNPLGGFVAEGPLLSPAMFSFVGGAEIPMRHGLTLGELALLLNDELAIGAQLDVVACDGWRRDHLFGQTGCRWVPPSPNMPRFETAMLYPGQVLLEGTNLSEGRGTATPFELVGAPFIDPFQLAAALRDFDLPGLKCLTVRFVPTFDKWQGQSCGGMSLHIVDGAAVRSFRATLAILACIHNLWPGELRWLPPPYEYETEKPPIDILYGGSQLREMFAAVDAVTPEMVDQLAGSDEARWISRTEKFRLYK